jgi:hypothetical protein
MMRELACLVCVALAACDQGVKRPDPREETAAAFAKMEYFTVKMCACKDAKCAQDVADEMTKWSQEWSTRHREPEHMTVAETKRAATIGERMSRCLQRAMGAGVEGSDR